MVDEPLALREAVVCMKMMTSSACPWRRTSPFQSRVGQVHAVDAGYDLHPAQAELFHAAPSSATARSTCCSGTVPSATKRSAGRYDPASLLSPCATAEAQLRVGPVVALFGAGDTAGCRCPSDPCPRAASLCSRASATCRGSLDVDFARQALANVTEGSYWADSDAQPWRPRPG